MTEQMSGASPGLKSVMDNRRNLGARGQEGSRLWEGYPLLSGTRSDEAIVPHSQKINSNFLLQMEWNALCILSDIGHTFVLWSQEDRCNFCPGCNKSLCHH